MTAILVTGLPRSGTSWVGKMLQASGQVVYVNEPLNPQRPPGRSPGVLNATVTHRFQYICPDNEACWLPAFRDTIRLRYRFAAEITRNRRPSDLARLAKYGSAFTLGRLRGRRALLDDPFALFSAQWFTERLGCRTIILIRDPVTFVASWQRLGWTVHVRDLLEQPLLMRDLLGDWAGELRAHRDTTDRLAAAALLWKVAHDAVRRTPGVLVARYEDLVEDPIGGFARLYAWTGLTWTDRAAERVCAASRGPGRSGTAFAWEGLSRTAYRPLSPEAALGSYRERLTPAEIDRVRDLTNPGQVVG